jgi:hypothetical protein
MGPSARQLEFRVLLRADRGGERALFVAGIPRQALLGAIAAEHAQGHDGDDD